MVLRHGLVPPDLIEAGEGEHTAVGAVDEVRLLARLPVLGHLLPLVEAVGGQQAPAPGEGLPERGLGVHRLRTRVDHAAPDRDVLRPRRHQAPAHDPQLPRHVPRAGVPIASAAAREHRVDRLGRGDVVVRLQRLADAVTLDAELGEEFLALTR